MRSPTRPCSPRVLDAEIVALTMGPPEARAALAHCLDHGAVAAVHLVDRRFAGADSLATARALAVAIERLAPALVLCGSHSLDGATGQLGPQLAELLGLVQVTAASALEMDVAFADARGSLRARARTGDLVSRPASARHGA